MSFAIILKYKISEKKFRVNFRLNFREKSRKQNKSQATDDSLAKEGFDNLGDPLILDFTFS